MLACKCVFLLAAVFQVTLCQQPPPPKCLRPPPEAGNARPHQCCKISPVIKNEDLEECGFKRILDGPPPKDHPPRFNNCSRELCVVKNLNLAKEDGETLDPEAVSQFLDKWGEENPGFEKGLEVSKKKCLGRDLPGPPGLCAITKASICVSNALILNCPKWEETEACTAMKNHLEECKEYFP